MDYKQKIEEKRQTLVDTLIGFIESNPTQWEAGWYSVPSVPPINGKTQKQYNGINALYLCVLSAMRGYTDPRWVTFNQAKELGANVKSGEKSSEIFYWSKYDKKTKQSFDDKTCDGMTFEEARKYMDENVRPVMKFYQVFNAGQCDNMPEYSRVATPEMEAEERRRQNALVEQIISNSGAPVSYDGGNRAYYSPSSDSIHLPEIKDFKSMQDYYSTALHEIAHSTGHDSRLSRNLSGLFGTPDYAKEELRAALASVFMQVEYGISIEGKHFENHGAYLASWLKSVKNDQKEFFSASADAEKITSYVADNYLQEHERQEHKENKQGTEQLIENLIFSEQDTEPKFEANTSFAKQVDAVLSGADTTSTHLKVMGTPLILRQLGSRNLPVLMTAKHLKNIVAASGEDANANYHGLDADIIKKLPELLSDPVMVMDSLTKDDSVVILTSTTDTENRPIIGAVKFDGKGYIDSVRLQANILTSVYGRNNFNDFIKRNVDANSILYWNKEKSQELIEVPGVQFPDKLNSLATNTIIRKAKAFVNSFDEKKENNIESSYKKAENITQPTAEQAKWSSIPLDAALIGAERGKSTQLKMPDGEYSSFVFFAPTKFIRQDEKSGAVQLSVNDSFKYTLMKGNQRVELTGSELRQAMAGQVIGQRAQRVLSAENAQTLSDIYRNVPQEMRQYPNWCVFTTRWNEEKGKKDKQIFSPILGLKEGAKMQWASIDKPETWATFDAAMKFAEENDCAGLVYALDGKGITCIDLDKSVVLNSKLADKPTDRAEGEMSALAARLSEELQGTYIETSASGNGIHIFVKDDLLAKGKYKNRAETPDGEIEVYDDRRFMSMTGNIRSNTLRLGKSPVATTAWLQEKLGEKVAVNQNAAPPGQSRQSDSAVIERISRSKKGAEFEALYKGEDVTGDNSRNDFKLLNMLAFFTDCDSGQMERIFRDSSLYRPEKGDAYVQRSVSKACETLQTRMSDRGFFGGGNNRGGGRSNGK